ncbi:hypothetical protein GCM10027563_30510 [Parasphingorhabdus pacifica]
MEAVAIGAAARDSSAAVAASGIEIRDMSAAWRMTITSCAHVTRMAAGGVM